MKKSLVVGASTKPESYAYKCIVMLRKQGFETFGIGNKKGTVKDVTISPQKVTLKNIHTVNIYLSPKNLAEYEDYILRLRPQRVLFPPGTENPEYEKCLDKAGIEHERACPLVMLTSKTY